MSYISRDTALCAVKKMKHFHNDVVGVYARYNMDLLDNLGRRNIVMSQAQERFFAHELSELYSGVIADGKTGQPDILIGSMDKELECKLTSRHKGGAISFQSDYETLAQKGELDYLYVVCDRGFEKFCVIHFEKLTTQHFRSPSPGSRGKVAMKKHKALPNAHILVGGIENLNQKNLEKIKEQLQQCNPDTKKYEKLEKRFKYWKDNPGKYSIVFESV